MTKTHYQTVAGIATKYHPMTGRISARRLDHKPGDPVAYLQLNHYDDHVQAHVAAAKLLIEKMGVNWVIAPVGVFDRDRFIWVMDISNQKEA